MNWTPKSGIKNKKAESHENWDSAFAIINLRRQYVKDIIYPRSHQHA